MEVIGFDFNGKPNSFKRMPQVFLRVSARLSKTGVFSYKDGREYRSKEEVFRADSLESLKGALVTDLHPSEKGEDNFLTPANAKDHIIGITEGVERDGSYLKGSLLIFHQDAIKAIEKGERKEISLGYKCRLEPIPGSVNGESYGPQATARGAKTLEQNPWPRAASHHASGSYLHRRLTGRSSTYKVSRSGLIHNFLAYLVFFCALDSIFF